MSGRKKRYSCEGPLETGLGRSRQPTPTMHHRPQERGGAGDGNYAAWYSELNVREKGSARLIIANIRKELCERKCTDTPHKFTNILFLNFSAHFPSHR
ncbi:hypothetical protein VNO77_01436 [Canavalia gladiata]|uniref:Uncharacterized protein n=1 Tax=Canavalia gladiata TaxID=3824 RepID=A0AAN9MRW1_CANGL